VNHSHNVRRVSRELQINRGVFSAVLNGVAQHVGDRLAEAVRVPVADLLAILFTAFATIGGMLFLNRLPMHYHPVLKHDNIHRGMDDRFFIVIESRDPKFNLSATKSLLEKAGGKEITELEA